jgi:hypothetical protein
MEPVFLFVKITEQKLVLDQENLRLPIRDRQNRLKLGYLELQESWWVMGLIYFFKNRHPIVFHIEFLIGDPDFRHFELKAKNHACGCKAEAGEDFNEGCGSGFIDLRFRDCG